MSRFHILIPAAPVALATLAGTASAHKGDPNPKSPITARTGMSAGVTVEVVNRDDSLQLVNRSDREVKESW